MRLRTIARSLAFGTAFVLAGPALADETAYPDPGLPPQGGIDLRPVWKEPAAAPVPVMQAPIARPAIAMPDAQTRAAWINECRRRTYHNDRDDGIGGGIIGGLVGGLLGNRIAGRGDRTAGTIIGGVGGAVIGAVIDRAEDSGRSKNRGKDYCEAYFDDYYATYAYNVANGYYGHPGMMAGGCGGCGMAVPVRQVAIAPQRPAQNCVETVTYEDVEVAEPVRVRAIPRRPAPPVKRVRVVPDKRIAL